MTFQKQKSDFLAKKDKSNKGSIDGKILTLVEAINEQDDHFTLSSCSGRISLLQKEEVRKKDSSPWLFVSHDLVSITEIKKIIEKIDIPEQEVWFKMEPAILHVAAKDIGSATKFMQTVNEAGFRRYGIISIKENKVAIEIIGSEFIETLFSKDKTVLLDNNYLEQLIEIANKKLESTWKRINKLKELLA